MPYLRPSGKVRLSAPCFSINSGLPASTAPEHKDRKNHQNDTADNSSEEEEVLLNLIFEPFYSAFGLTHEYKSILAKFSPQAGCVL